MGPRNFGKPGRRGQNPADRGYSGRTSFAARYPSGLMTASITQGPPEEMAAPRASFRAFSESTRTASKPSPRATAIVIPKSVEERYRREPALGEKQQQLADTVALGAFAQDAFAEEFGFKIDDAIIRGAGGGMPLGYSPLPEGCSG